MNLLQRLMHYVRWWRRGPAWSDQVSGELLEIQRRLHDLERGQHALAEHFGQALAAKAERAELTHMNAALLGHLGHEAANLRDRLDALLQASHRRAADPLHANTPPTTRINEDTVDAAALQAFYVGLERQFRGTAQEISERQSVYRDWVVNAPAGDGADVGCGRGEWLALVQSWGRRATGVDSNTVFVESLKACGHQAVCADAVQWLRTQEANHFAFLSAFHVVEHLPLAVMLAFMDEARRVLKPGGLLLLETPDPDNLLVATQGFWLDPTHRQPLPSALLAFVAEHSGLKVQTVLRLNPPDTHAQAASGLPDSTDPALRNWILRGRDYAVIARKPDITADIPGRKPTEP